MIKKLTLATVATLALLAMPLQAEGNKCAAGKCGAGMTDKAKGDHKGYHKMHHKGHGSFFLIKLPSPMRIIMKNMDDPKLALTAEQKTKFEAQKKEMMPKMMKLKEEISAVIKEVKSACKKSETAAQQTARIEKLAKLKTEATMIKLACIDMVKATLSKEQWATLKELRKENMSKMKEKMKCMKKMKCTSCSRGSK